MKAVAVTTQSPKSEFAWREQVMVAGLGHPTGARQMCFPAPTAKLGRLVWIAAQDEAGRLSPVGAVLIGVEQAQIGQQMTLVVVGERLRPRRLVGHGMFDLGGQPCVSACGCHGAPLYQARDPTP